MVIAELAARRGEPARAQVERARRETWLRPGAAEARPRDAEFVHERLGRPGVAARTLLRCSAWRVVLVHDELDIPFDTLKLKVGGGHGGHNGIRDVAKALGTPEFPRVRVGIGRPPGRQDPADWVLDPFSAAERRSCRSSSQTRRMPWSS
jgi:PTH1 family peptidyl-tRNA hydrolase